MAGLTTNAEVFIYAPSKNAHRGKWEKVRASDIGVGTD